MTIPRGENKKLKKWDQFEIPFCSLLPKNKYTGMFMRRLEYVLIEKLVLNSQILQSKSIIFICVYFFLIFNGYIDYLILQVWKLLCLSSSMIQPQLFTLS